MRHNRNRRKGVILLVVLGLLALFTLVAITFVIVASQARRGALIASKAQQQGTPPDVLVRRAILEIARGSHNPYSVIGPHSLLEDMYGNDGFSFTIPKNGVGGATADGFSPINCIGLGSMMFFDVPLVSPWDGVSGYYNGRIITMVNGPAAGQSSRIMRYEVNSSVTNSAGGPMNQFIVPLHFNFARLWISPFKGMSTSNSGALPGAQWNSTGAPVAGNTFLINGGAFNGTGFGFNPGTPANPNATSGSATSGMGLLNYLVTVQGVDLTKVGLCETALLPNRTDPQLYDPTGLYPNQCGFGGADEDYDLPDYQNMMLAGFSWVNAGSQPPFPIVFNNSWNVTHPSLHRPDLVAYWLNRVMVASGQPARRATNATYDNIPVALRRKIILRPEPSDHYYDGADTSGAWDPSKNDFSGHTFDPINGPWDVDNDGDGVFDSIWVDLGMPAEVAPDGTLYKPLFAFLVVDLDSRLNLNAHGNRAHYRWVSPGNVQLNEFFDPREEALIGPWALRTKINYPPNPPNANLSYQIDQGYPVAASGPFAGGFPQVSVANGMGFSPAEVNLGDIVGDSRVIITGGRTACSTQPQTP